MTDEEKGSYRYYDALNFHCPDCRLQMKHLSLGGPAGWTEVSVIAPCFDPQGRQHIAGESRAAAWLKTCQVKITSSV